MDDDIRKISKDMKDMKGISEDQDASFMSGEEGDVNPDDDEVTMQDADSSTKAELPPQQYCLC